MKKSLKTILKPAYYLILPAVYRLHSLLPFERSSKDEFGKCSVCGKFTKFRYHQIIDENSKITISCGFDKEFTEVINVTNSLHCKFCHSKFRVRCAATSLLKHYGKKMHNSIKEFIESADSSVKILETASTDGIFSHFDNDKIIRSEYYDDVTRGEYKGNIRSEDLEALSFDDNSLDVIVSLDVLEHVANPEKAYKEMHRVLKKCGVIVITVPIDIRNKKTTKFAEIVEGELKLLRPPAYHSDKLREEGALVFTEFGMDVSSHIEELGYNVEFDEYETSKEHIKQFVIVIIK